MYALCSHLGSVAPGAGLAASLFMAGMLGGFTHCAGMCGPFVMAQTGPRNEGPFLQKLKAAALFPYHFGRMTTYVGLAVLFNLVLRIGTFLSPVHDWIAAALLAMAALLFLTSAFPRLSVLFPWAARLRLPVPGRWLYRLAASLMRGHPYLLGVLLGFMPCGLVMAALFAASAAPTPSQAGFAMAAFAAGTLPALWLAGIGGAALGMKWPKAGQILTGGAMIFSSLMLMVLAGQMVLKGI